MIRISLIKSLARKFPDLPVKLKKAGMLYTPEEFVKRTLISAIYLSIGILFISFLFTFRILDPVRLIVFHVVGFPLMFMFVFFYFFQLPVVKISKIDREINKEIVYAGRFMAVELESGVTLYDAMKNVGHNFVTVGAYFNDIINRVNIGTTIEEAVTEAIEFSPSDSLTKIFWQISNSLRTGGDVSEPLKTVVETLVREQQIMMNDYAKKLNPLAMFYMLIAIIIPSLGVTMLTIVSIFMGFELSLMHMMLVAGFIAFIQFMFVAMISSIRPPVEL